METEGIKAIEDQADEFEKGESLKDEFPEETTQHKFDKPTTNYLELQRVATPKQKPEQRQDFDSAGLKFLKSYSCNIAPVSSPSTINQPHTCCTEFEYSGSQYDNVRSILRPTKPFGTEPNVVDGFCHICRWQIDHLSCMFRNDTSPEVEHWPTLHHLVIAAQENCRVCSTVKMVKFEADRSDDSCFMWTRLSLRRWSDRLVSWNFHFKLKDSHRARAKVRDQQARERFETRIPLLLYVNHTSK